VHQRDPQGQDPAEPWSQLTCSLISPRSRVSRTCPGSGLSADDENSAQLSLSALVPTGNLQHVALDRCRSSKNKQSSFRPRLGQGGHGHHWGTTPFKPWLRRGTGPTHNGRSVAGRSKIPSEFQFRHAAVALIVALTIWGYVDVRRRGEIIPGHIESHSTDFTVFTEAGAAFFDGRDPYRVTNPRGWHYLYPPLFALLVSPLVSLDSKSQVVVWFVVSLALGLGCYGETRRLWRLLATGGANAHSRYAARCDPKSEVVVFVGLAVCLPALECLQRRQLGIALMYPLLLCFRLALGGRVWRGCLAGVVLAWPVVVKLIPALPVGILLIQSWARTLAKDKEPGTVYQAAAVSSGVALGVLLFAVVIPAACIAAAKVSGTKSTAFRHLPEIGSWHLITVKSVPDTL